MHAKVLQWELVEGLWNWVIPIYVGVDSLRMVHETSM